MGEHMKVIKPLENVWCEKQPLDAFDMADIQAPRISIVGAGGKTTILESLANDYRFRGKQAIVTTTTHMFYPDDRWAFTNCQDLNYIQNELRTHQILWIGTPCENGKISSVSEELKKSLSNLPYPILVEADGSKRLPFKMPGENEPVLFPGTTNVFGVLGMDALHKRIGEISFRSERVAEFLGKSLEDTLEEADFVKIIKSKQGLKKHVASHMNFKIILNKADNYELTQHALSIRNKLRKETNETIYITSYQLGGYNEDID